MQTGMGTSARYNVTLAVLAGAELAVSTSERAQVTANRLFMPSLPGRLANAETLKSNAKTSSRAAAGHFVFRTEKNNEARSKSVHPRDGQVIPRRMTDDGGDPIELLRGKKIALLIRGRNGAFQAQRVGR
jgi:hypothetical protein